MSRRLRERAFHYLALDELIPDVPEAMPALDVGCGAGRLMFNLRQVGWLVEGVEPDAIAAKNARALTGCPVHGGDFRSAKLPLGTYHLIVLHHVLEHMDDPVASLARAHDLLAPCGRVVIVSPNPQALGAKIFAGAWFPWDPPRHLVLPTAHTLCVAAERLGMKTVSVRTLSRSAHISASYSREYRAGRKVSVSRPNIRFIDLWLRMLERVLVLVGLPWGDELLVALVRSDDISRG